MPSEEPDVSPGGRPPPVPRLRRLLGPLALYHVLLLIGAALVVEGHFRSNPEWLAAGVALIVLGILLEVAILGWTARLARARPPVEAASAPPPVPSGPVRLCVSCAWRGCTRRTLCPRCGRPGLVWPGVGPSSNPPAPAVPPSELRE